MTDPKNAGFPPAYSTSPYPPGANPPPQGYAPPPQGYAPPPQGYAPPPQGYAPPPQGYAPPPQAGYGPPQPYAPPPAQMHSSSSTNVVVVGQQAPVQTVIVQRQGVNHVLHFIISLFFWPWIIVWIILCIADDS
ncbi:hypothetical protein ACOMHN_021399 [Nucella lapillus]